MEELDYLDPKLIRKNPYQPRKHFDTDKLNELAQSISENGLIQPIVVRKSSLIGYELLAGERRLRASIIAGLQKIPALVKEISDQDLRYQAIIENLQREDLNPVEEALSYKQLLEEGLTQEKIALQMGKSRPYISNSIRLLQLSPNLLHALEIGQLSQGHARLLLPLSKEKQEEWWARIQNKGWSVRKLEQELKGSKQSSKGKKKDIFIDDLEQELQKQYGTKITIKTN